MVVAILGSSVNTPAFVSAVGPHVYDVRSV